MVSLASTLGKADFITSIGGERYVSELFAPLFVLCSVEETLVREAAAQAIRSLFVRKINTILHSVYSILNKDKTN